MSSRLRLRIILTNVLLCLSFIGSSLSIWIQINRWSEMNIATIWDPIFITPYRIPNTPQVQMPVFPLLNAPFILFWLGLAVNLYFIVALQRSREKS